MNRQPEKPATTPLPADATRLRRPVHPELPPRLSAGAARDAVHKAVTELHATGALDAGNADVLDGWLDSLRPQWHAHAAMAATEQAAVAQQVLGESDAAAVAARERAEAAKAELGHTERLVTAYEQALLPGDGPDQADRRNRRPDLERLEGLTSSRWTSRALLLLLPVVAAGDFVTFYMTLAGLLREDAVLTWILVGSFTFASVAVLHAAGHTAKNIREGQGGLGKVWVGLMALAWAALGGIAFYVRTQYVPTTAAGAGAGFGADAATVVPTGPDPLLSALLLGGLYLASGVLAFWIGFSGHRPRMTSYQKLRADLVRRRTASATAERALVAAERLLENARAEQARVAQRTADAALSIDAEITELKELARIHLAGLLGQPAATNAVTTGRGLDPAAPAATGPEPAAPVAGSGFPDVATPAGPRHAADGLWGSVPIKVNGHARPAAAR
ncbi:hypothetical protein [Modestobacter lapidis]|nr:hypothetical protein [Modestobacter lapidis]